MSTVFNIIYPYFVVQKWDTEEITNESWTLFNTFVLRAGKDETTLKLFQMCDAAEQRSKHILGRDPRFSPEKHTHTHKYGIEEGKKNPCGDRWKLKLSLWIHDF